MRGQSLSLETLEILRDDKVQVTVSVAPRAERESGPHADRVELLEFVTVQVEVTNRLGACIPAEFIVHV